ncbi:hypothetical protein NQ318_001271 [Aromia moschata]|uniref:Uncharacterized protein n=1 Tax=Aromia moschata TaxID=1265417 RepID=A0AAV8ZGK8_9CUCU|nr:hypothetical protein NQ318_001271 [Aromia moschata]
MYITNACHQRFVPLLLESQKPLQNVCLHKDLKNSVPLYRKNVIAQNNPENSPKLVENFKGDLATTNQIGKG